jgi:hypothetical protein
MQIGLGMMGLAIVWWFLYYANYLGPFELLGLKSACSCTTAPASARRRRESAALYGPAFI